ncbi:MAG: Ni/Fe hydrogenase [Rhodobacteraceae bacterium]|jgi:urease accessory protein|nr:Ni/Fe hydrogenase [Paracoccaceae bacterium]
MVRMLLVISLILSANMGFAHSGEGIDSGFESGFWHPILGWDHVVAMVAVGLWGAFLGSPAIFVLPIVFPIVMAFGGALGVIGVPIPFIETGIALSGVVLGLLILFAVKAPNYIAAIVVGIFAIFHGHAHGGELPEQFSAYGYSVGFVIGTGLLHSVGIGFGFLAQSPLGEKVVRIVGGVIAFVGAAFLFGFA